jgi:protein ImuB
MSALYLCIHLRNFAAQALARQHSELLSTPLVVLRGEAPLERVFALNPKARQLGVELGMSRPQAESFAARLLRRDRPQEDAAFAELMGCAQRFSPRIEILASPGEEDCGATLLLDVSSSELLLGNPRQIAAAVRGALCAMRYEVSVAVARNACTALLAARGLPGAVTIAPGDEAATLSPLPLWVLEPAEEQGKTLAAWGIRTLGQLAALPPRSLAARLGQSGLHLQAQARGEYNHLLVPAEEPADAPLCAGIELEEPVALLEPLLFLLNQLLEQVIARAAQRSLAIASVELNLELDKNGLASGPLDRRTIRPALPERDRASLLKLLQLELETHPPISAVTALRLVAHPARPQTAQQGLFAAQAPEPGRLEILLARLRKLVGEGRAGAPELLDSRAPEAFRMTRFAPGPAEARVPNVSPLWADVGGQNSAAHAPALRLLRPPRAIAVELRGGAPVALRDQGRQRIVEASSGPWRTSGAWWTHPAWCREEWEIFLQDEGERQNGGIEGAQHPPPFGANSGAAQPKDDLPRCLRLAHDPASGAWYLIGMYD